MNAKRLYLIDATAFCYRAFYALPGLATSFGQPTSAIYGFINILNKILKEEKPRYVAVCFDVSRDTFRQKKFAEYKINRPAMPEGLSSQLPLIKEAVSAYGMAIFEKEGFEADDVIATLSKKAKEKGFAVTIVSSDKDMLQLVDEKTTVLSPYKDEGTSYDAKKVFERYGLLPKQIPDVIALMGDDVDNIPGIPGIGEKTAVSLIQSFNSVEKMLGDADKIKSEKIRNAVKSNSDKIILNKELVLLNDDLDLDFRPEKIEVGEPDHKELFRLFKYLEFKKFIKDLGVPKADAGDRIPEAISQKQLKEKLKPGDELFLYGSSSSDMLFSTGDDILRLDSFGGNSAAILADRMVRKTGHDLKKTKVALAKENIVLDGMYFDTMLAAYLLNPSRPEYSLNEIAWDYLPQDFVTQDTCAGKAVGLIVKLKPRLENELNDKSLIGLFRDIEMPLIEVLAEMELTGIKLDVDLLKDLSQKLEKRLGKLVEDIYGISGCQFNINSPKQLREVLFGRLKLPVVKRTKTGPSTDEEVLRALASSHKLPAILLEYRQLTKLKSTYVDSLPQLIDPKTGRVHASFNQAATETGRLSSTNPNLQNIPVKTEIGRKIRQAIIALEKDSWILSCDYSQIELRVLAHISGDRNLIAEFRGGKDIHKATAALIYGIKEKDVDDPMREVAKRVNFGIVYGLTSYGLSRDLGLSLEEAQGFIDAYFLRYPKVKEYIHEQIQKAKDSGFVTTILGRRRYLPDINNKNQMIRQFAERQAVNTPIQGSASDLIKLAMIQIHNEIKEKRLGSRLIIQIHDELVFDVPDKEKADFVPLVRQRMENALKLDVPIIVIIKKGKNWLDMEEVK
ncbi:MAG: DNA polymerase I [Candidatus Omnitrophica bacterium]|nr:DNA polymerase I [Candidatus Omnitrophota bacterium]